MDPLENLPLSSGRAVGVPQQAATTQRRIVATVTMSVLIHVVAVLVSFDSAVRETFVKAFGERSAGISNSLLVHALQTLLYLPIPWVFWHGTQLMFQAMEDGRRIGIGYLFAVCGFHPHLRRLQIVCIGGLVYFVVIRGAWIACAAARGI